MLNVLNALSVDYGTIGNVMVKVDQSQIMFAPQLDKLDMYRYLWTINSYKVCKYVSVCMYHFSFVMYVSVFFDTD